MSNSARTSLDKCTKPVPKFMGQVKNSTKQPTATVAVGDTCETTSFVRSRIEEFKFQIARGWLNSKMAAAYLGISVKTLHNMKSKGHIHAEGKRQKPIFRIAELDKFLMG